MKIYWRASGFVKIHSSIIYYSKTVECSVGRANPTSGCRHLPQRGCEIQPGVAREKRRLPQVWPVMIVQPQKRLCPSAMKVPAWTQPRWGWKIKPVSTRGSLHFIAPTPGWNPLPIWGKRTDAESQILMRGSIASRSVDWKTGNGAAYSRQGPQASACFRAPARSIFLPHQRTSPHQRTYFACFRRVVAERQ